MTEVNLLHDFTLWWRKTTFSKVISLLPIPFCPLQVEGVQLGACLPSFLNVSNRRCLMEKAFPSVAVACGRAPNKVLCWYLRRGLIEGFVLSVPSLWASALRCLMFSFQLLLDQRRQWERGLMGGRGLSWALKLLSWEDLKHWETCIWKKSILSKLRSVLQNKYV